jgi:hypothetical protein
MNDEQLMKELEDNLPAKSCFWRHTWTIWGKSRTVIYKDTYAGTTTNYLVQCRRCLRCGKEQKRNV